MTSIIEYWREISLAIGGVASFVIGRKSARFLEKQQQVDAIATMQKTYDTFLGHYDSQYVKLVEQVNKLQSAFLELQLSYAREIEISQNWEKLHSELEKQYRELEKKYDNLANQYKESEKKHEDLEKLYAKLKADFDKHKKATA